MGSPCSYSLIEMRRYANKAKIDDIRVLEIMRKLINLLRLRCFCDNYIRYAFPSKTMEMRKYYWYFFQSLLLKLIFAWIAVWKILTIIIYQIFVFGNWLKNKGVTIKPAKTILKILGYNNCFQKGNDFMNSV